jgi:hypothetical protein
MFFIKYFLLCAGKQHVGFLLIRKTIKDLKVLEIYF